MLPQWLKNHGLEEMSVEQAAKNPEVLAALDRAVERTNEAVSRAESIRSFRVLTDDFTEANGLLTPSLKVKRAAALAKYADVVDYYLCLQGQLHAHRLTHSTCNHSTCKHR